MIKDGQIALGKKLGFSFNVFVHAFVIIEMFVSDVGQNGKFKMGTPITELIERVRSNFTNDVGITALVIVGKNFLNFFGIGAGGVETGTADGADNTAFNTRIFQNFLN